MSQICFASYEIHPTTWGGCGVLLHHAAEMLLQRGHEVVFLLDIPADYFEKFNDADRLAFINASRCRAYHVDTLCEDLPWSQREIPNPFQWKALRFAHALSKLAEKEHFDFVEFFEYCGVAYYALIRKLFGFLPSDAVVGVRLHNSIELIDRFEATKTVDRDRYVLYGLEHGAIGLSEVVLTPTENYYKEYYHPLYSLSNDRIVISQSPKPTFPAVSRGRGIMPFKIVYFGRVYQFKGAEQLVKAAILLLKRRPQSHVVFEFIGYDSPQSPIGDSYVTYLTTLVPDHMREHFHFTGQLSHDEVADHLKESLFAVFPNLFESFCYALHEVYESGIPVIINDLPGFRDFFTHEKNALIYDGSTKGLLSVMERMLDDHELRERLCKPYPVAENSLGRFYEAPYALSPVRSDAARQDTFRTLVIVLEDAQQGNEQETLSSLAAQTYQDFSFVRLSKACGDERGAFLWMGQFWVARSRNDIPISALDIETKEAILILNTGDRVAARWLELCVGVLRARPNMAFAGTWAKVDGKLVPSTLDVTPEAYPFWNGSDLTRTLIRTDPACLLVDLFDSNLGALGEIGYLWEGIRRWGRGCLLAEPLLEIPHADDRPADHIQLHYLLSRYGTDFGPRLSLLAGITRHQYLDKLKSFASQSEDSGGSVSERASEVLIAERLEIRELLMLALSKACHRLWSAIPGFRARKRE